jgi:hypothetical protein
MENEGIIKGMDELVMLSKNSVRFQFCVLPDIVNDAMLPP